MLVMLAQSDKILNTADLGTGMNVSPKYLRKLAGPLEKANLIKSIQGIHGGYQINKHPREITLKMIFNAFDEDTSLSSCVKIVKCSLFEDCLVRPLWDHLENVLEAEFFKLSINDILEGTFTRKK
jgi:Rrf2 family iron-sulfur cluster assembly transcriptional regulator